MSLMRPWRREIEIETSRPADEIQSRLGRLASEAAAGDLRGVVEADRFHLVCKVPKVPDTNVRGTIRDLGRQRVVHLRLEGRLYWPLTGIVVLFIAGLQAWFVREAAVPALGIGGFVAALAAVLDLWLAPRVVTSRVIRRIGDALK